MPDVGYHRYEGYPLEEKIAWVAQGAGTSSLAAARDALHALGRDLVESETRLRGLVARLGGLWLGTSGATPVDAMLAATRLGEHLADVQRVRHAVPSAVPPRDGIDDGCVDDHRVACLFDVQADIDARVLGRRAVEDEADRQLYRLEAAARRHLADLP